MVLFGNDPDQKQDPDSKQGPDPNSLFLIKVSGPGLYNFGSVILHATVLYCHVAKLLAEIPVRHCVN